MKISFDELSKSSLYPNAKINIDTDVHPEREVFCSTFIGLEVHSDTTLLMFLKLFADWECYQIPYITCLL
jgi:hypothetical protein